MLYDVCSRQNRQILYKGYLAFSGGNKNTCYNWAPSGVWFFYGYYTSTECIINYIFK